MKPKALRVPGPVARDRDGGNWRQRAAGVFSSDPPEANRRAGAESNARTWGARLTTKGLLICLGLSSCSAAPRWRPATPMPGSAPPTCRRRNASCRRRSKSICRIGRTSPTSTACCKWRWRCWAPAPRSSSRPSPTSSASPTPRGCPSSPPCRSACSADFDVGGKADAARSGWRHLTTAILKFKNEPSFTCDQLITAYSEGEDIVGNVQFRTQGSAASAPHAEGDGPDKHQ